MDEALPKELAAGSYSVSPAGDAKRSPDPHADGGTNGVGLSLFWSCSRPVFRWF